MDKPPSDPQFIQTFSYYWAALSAEGQGMVMAFLIAGLKVIYDDKKHNWRRDVAETLLMPLLFFGTYKGGVWLLGFDERAAVPISAVVSVLGLQFIRRTVETEVRKRFPKK